MTKQEFRSLLKAAQFDQLFISEMGWNNYHGRADLPPIEIEGTPYHFRTIAERSGFQVLTTTVATIPTPSLCRRIDTQLRKYAHDYITIYLLTDHQQQPTQHHLWAAPIRQVEKRNIVTIEYATVAQADFLYAKLDGLSFGIEEETTIIDVRERVQAAFALNSEEITKGFYSGFKKQHDAFTNFITGIDDHITSAKENRNKQWYTSVMLNRLMFCYFIQKKGFLDNNVHYLRDKLAWCQQQRGAGTFFHSFYKGFLTHLFQDGLNTPRTEAEELAFHKVYGRIPYLNGGMFDHHQIELDYQDIDIDDQAFEQLFDFFDKWQWHLDTRITASGRDINPDVLGYIFEQYINDRAKMGAYYTKEDITEYIGRNCILPALFDKVANSTEEMKQLFTPTGEVWQKLQKSGTRYLFEPLLKGYTPNWQEEIPAEIARGIDPQGGQLLERRELWNTPTPEPWALPTEIWRETIARLQRCDELRHKIAEGELTDINHFITYNLDIRTFTQELLEETTNHRLIAHFYHALQSISILDPTCGSGAFLFAALNILEPLYEVCILRMQEFHQSNSHLFTTELEEIEQKYQSNIQYFIYKSIILRNLYGVDIMDEAVEIAKLRLFLKMVAVVEVDRRAPNLGLDPLPDIDFNIRCGNTLVGYATLHEAKTGRGDMFEQYDFENTTQPEMQKVALAYNQFRKIQLSQQEDIAAFKEAKQELEKRLTQLRIQLDKQLYSATATGQDYQLWHAKTQPFHWVAEFYQIIQENGGFDVIIGNPPYVEYNKKVNGVAVSDLYQLSEYKTLQCGNLYAYTLERSKVLLSNKGYISMIVPLSGHSTERMEPLVANFYKKFGLRLHLNLSADANPQKLFEGVKFRLVIFFATNNGNGSFSSKYTRWLAEERNTLFTSHVVYNNNEHYQYKGIIPKVPDPLFMDIIKKMSQQDCVFFNREQVGEYVCLYHNAPVNWIRTHRFTPYFHSERDGERISSQLKPLVFKTEMGANVASSLLSSSLFFIWWIVNSDCYHLNKPEIVNFPYKWGIRAKLIHHFAKELAADMKHKSVRRVYTYKTSGRVEYDEFYMKLSKPIIDKIDKNLAEEYGFTEEELDFIINYDIKYRMGDELNKEDE